ncbi:hypothetical protein J5X07_03365 [Actinomyces bowdenii]|uniref:Uncharacterized protein n=1 Tax=Actinomyces bowdenii TaxID=131109 RepID=A0A3P1V7M4_9ACTO|nr:hypothetical protein [Actinomyces bowdenii]MBO3724082.1 hypothetical protein [Actinomyces bowdenii]MCR2052563.1 hypothetical protein [Actinomyces bowdenii]RRD30192.1 hypothetical protein EII10_03770 [Actinomyces bowdenii]
MSTLVAPISTPVVEAVRTPAVEKAREERQASTTGHADITVVTTVLAILAILGMFTIFAAIANAMPVVVATAMVSVVVCVGTAFRELRRAGM